MLKRYIILLAICLCLTLPALGSSITSKESSVYELPGWWKDATFYEIFVRSFYDSNGDGEGDFNGIIQKLDYLNDGNPKTTSDLGITGIWLMPIHPSPSYHGYDVRDFYGVNRDYGSMEAFKTLVKEAHKRGIRVILDLVMNHCSEQNPWFKEARTNINSPKRDWFIWSKTNPGYVGPWGQEVWHLNSVDGYYYYGLYAWWPDFNFNNPQVVSEMEKVASFWIKETGVDGFRIDSAKHIVEEGEEQGDTEANHKFWKKWQAIFKKISSEAVEVGEVWSDIDEESKYVQGDELDAVFVFPLAGGILEAAGSGNAREFVSDLKQSQEVIPPGRGSPFITNHDMNRVMSQLAGSVPRAKVAASLLFASPGVPFIYYGEEIGMEGSKPDEDIRRPMQWSDAPQAGFTTGRPWRAPREDYKKVNVAAQTKEADSLLSHYRKLISLRNSHPAMRSDKVDPFTTDNRALFAGLRVKGNEAIVIIVNMGREPLESCSLSLANSSLTKGSYLVSPLMGKGKFANLSVKSRGEIEDYRLTTAVPAYGTLILYISSLQ